MAEDASAGQKRKVASIIGLMAYLLAGPLIWAAQFSVIYALHALACAASPQPATVGGWLFPTMVVVTVTSVAAALAILAWGRRIRRAIRGSSDDAGWGAYAVICNVLTILSTIAIFWSGVTIGLLEACDQTQF